VREILDVIALQTILSARGDRDGQPLRWQKVIFSPSGDIVYGLGSDHRVHVWDVISAKKIRTMGQTSDWTDAMALSLDGKRLAVGSTDYWVAVWDLTVDHQLYLLEEDFEDSIMSLAFSHDGRVLASGDGSGSIMLWDISNGRKIAICSDNYGWIRDLAFLPGRKMLVSGSVEHYAHNKSDGVLKVWNVENNQILQTSTVIQVGFPVEAVAVDASGETIASGSWDVAVALWDVTTGRRKATLVGHEGKVYTVAYSPNSKILASGSQDATVRLWDTTTNQELSTINHHSDAVLSVAFSPDGKRLASASFDHTISIWKLDY